ncbi:MAG: DUF6128 domain-containing protein [Lachnospiraceae bacterium]
MINRKILYFYEYASEVRGRCLGHAKVMVCGQKLKLTLAFSLPRWEKINCKLYFAAENNEGEVVVTELGEIMPCDIMTVYHLDVPEERLGGMLFTKIIHICLFLRKNEEHYLKAVSGIFDITSKSLDSLLDVQKKREYQEKKCRENKCEETEYQEIKGKENECEETEFKERKCQEVKCEETEFKERKCQENKSLENESQESVCQKTEYKNTEVRSIKEFVGQLMATRPEYRPFSSGKISYAVRIGVGDVMNLSILESGLKDNSFLLHGFYRYKHILLASSRIRGQINFYILVPGVKSEREQRLADMYGFHDFISLDGQPAKPGSFGYYSWMLS